MWQLILVIVVIWSFFGVILFNIAAYKAEGNLLKQIALIIVCGPAVWVISIAIIISDFKIFPDITLDLL